MLFWRCVHFAPTTTDLTALLLEHEFQPLYLEHLLGNGIGHIILLKLFDLAPVATDLCAVRLL